MPNIYNMTIPQFIEQGWSIIKHKQTGRPTAIVSTIPDWKDLTWAQQTYYSGKYRFSEAGILEISVSELSGANEKTVGRFVSDIFPNEYVTPTGALAGPNERLRKILERSRVELECRSYDDSALVHIGPDGSAVYTNEAGWGSLSHWPKDKTYIELDEFNTCYWEISPAWVSEPPCWACPKCNGF